MKFRIGIDVGGTFTDFLLFADDGSTRIYKVLSTPDDPSIATMSGLELMAADRGAGVAEFLRDVAAIVHGTTVTTNAVLTNTGARTGLLTTAGFRDALEMRRGIREEQYNNFYRNVRPLVDRFLRWPVDERVAWDGTEEIPMDPASVRAGLDLFASEGVEAVAVCFMNSFANPLHERAARDEARAALPGAYITASADLLPSIRFYDRVSTTVLNCYVGPILSRYLKALVARLAGFGFGGVLLIMQSNGGVVSPEVACDRAAMTLLSGPAGGPVAGVSYAGDQGYSDCITVDMGGTSFDASLVKDKRPFVTCVGDVNRLRLALPMLDVVTIGAGGGSIGWIDEGGLLRMGPQSAGAKPGPSCYARGGSDPTCTDADLLLGYLDADFFAGGRMKLDRAAAEKAIAGKIARPMGLDLMAAAAGMYRVINVNMSTAVREVAIQHGQDPRDFPLIVAGGAGPNHACMIALELEMPVLIVPRESSIFCAAGMLMSDLKHDFVQTYAVTLDKAEPSRFRAVFDAMTAEGLGLLASEGIPRERAKFVYQLDLRYVQQYHEVSVEVPQREIDEADFEAIAGRFHPLHNALFGYSLEEEGAPVEMINMRLSCIGVTKKPSFKPKPRAGFDPSPALKGERPVFLPRKGEFARLPVYDAEKLEFGNFIEGPAILEQVNTTTFVTPEYDVLVDRFGSFTLFLRGRRAEIEGRIL